MNIQRAFFIFILGMSGCSTRTLDVTLLPDVITKERALVLAEQHVRKEPSMSAYKMTEVYYNSSERAWVVDYSRGPRVAFGDHNWFGVVVKSPKEIFEIWE